MPYQRFRPRANDDAHRDRLRGQEAAEAADYRHDDRTSPFRARAGGGGRPAGGVPGSTTPPPEAVEVLRFATVGAGGASGHTFSLFAYSDDGSVRRVHGPITLPQGSAPRPVRISGMAYGLGGAHVSPRPRTLYLHDGNNDRVIPYNLSDGTFGYSLTGVPPDVGGIVVGDAANEVAASMYLAGFTGGTTSPVGRIYSSTALSSEAFAAQPRAPRLHASNTRPTGLAYQPGRDAATSYLWVADSNGHLYRYTEEDVATAIAGNSLTTIAGTEFDLAALGDTPGNRYPNAVAYGLRLDGMETLPRLYVSDNTARRVFAYGLPGPSGTSLAHMSTEDIEYGQNGLNVGTGSIFGLASFPTSVEAAAHANMAIPHGPPPVASGTPRLAILMPMDRVAVVALTSPPRLMGVPTVSGSYTQVIGTSRHNVRRQTTMIRNAQGLDSGVVSADGGVFGIGYSATSAGAGGRLHWTSPAKGLLAGRWYYTGLTSAALRIYHVSRFRPVFGTPGSGFSGRWGYEQTNDVECAIAARRAGARQSAIALPIAVTAGTLHVGLSKIMLLGTASVGGEFGYYVYTFPLPAVGQTSVTAEDRWEVTGDRVTPVAIADVQTRQGTRVAVLDALGRRVLMFTNSGTAMPGETVDLVGLQSEEADGGAITGATTLVDLAQASPAP